jgi:perosamine synthetase
MFGFPVDLPRQNGRRVIEDCAQALGTYVDAKSVGLSGNVGIFSFYATKIMTSGGQGGMLISRDRKIVEMVRDYRQFDCRDDRSPRFNFQMTDLQAAVGRVQLRKLPFFLSRRREIFEQYRDGGLDVFDIKSNCVLARYRTVIRSNNPQRIIDGLARNGIKAIVPVADWELLGPADQFSNAAAFARTTVSLPTYPSLTDKDVSLVINAVKASIDD